MPCEKCGKIMYVDHSDGEKDVCLRCDKVNHLPHLDAELVATYRVQKLSNIFSRYIRHVNKYKLIGHLLGYREKLASEFYLEIPSVNVYKLLAVTILIKRIMKEGNPNGSQDLGGSVEEIVDNFIKLIELAEEGLQILEGFATLKFKRNIPYVSLRFPDAIENYTVIHREEWKNIMKSYEKELFMNTETAKVYFEKNKDAYEKLKTTKKASIPYTPETFIEKAFPAINMYYTIFQKDTIFQQHFDFTYLLKSGINLDDINKIIRQLPLTFKTKLMAAIHVKEFNARIRRVYNLNKVKKNLVFSESNNDIFPFFVSLPIGKRKKDIVLITPNFYRLMSIYLHAIFFKKEFDKQKEIRGKMFESSIVKKEFESKKFHYIPNYKDKPKKPTIEIDGIAFDENFIYVCEVKNWNIRPFFESMRMHQYFVRDLKGVVDGKEYTTIGNVTKEKRRPSLLEKIEFVKNNQAKVIGDSKSRTIIGFVITSFMPVKKIYRNIRFISSSEIKDIENPVLSSIINLEIFDSR